MNEGSLSPDDVAILGLAYPRSPPPIGRASSIATSRRTTSCFRTAECRKKIIDFGIAKILEEGEGTIVDGFKGKLSYASPEQLGFHGGRIDGRSDFYSLGLVLVAAALGRPMPMGATVVEAVDARWNFKKLPEAIDGSRFRDPSAPRARSRRSAEVHRLFVVPGGVEGDTAPISTGGVSRGAPAGAGTSGLTGIFSGRSRRGAADRSLDLSVPSRVGDGADASGPGDRRGAR